jgi:hypothetical protein
VGLAQRPEDSHRRIRCVHIDENEIERAVRIELFASFLQIVSFDDLRSGKMDLEGKTQPLPEDTMTVDQEDAGHSRDSNNTRIPQRSRDSDNPIELRSAHPLRPRHFVTLS